MVSSEGRKMGEMNTSKDNGKRLTDCGGGVQTWK